jgi:3-oxoadipate enol-lactonase
MPQLSINGLSMNVETYGESGDWILLLHGALSDNLQNWRMILNPMAQRFRLIGIDMRGHGKTDNPTGSFTLDDLTADALAVLDHFGIARAHVLGCSLGGYVAMSLRAKHPERVGSLGLAGAKVGWTPEMAEDRFSFFQPEVIAQTYPFWLPHMAKAHSAHYGPEHWKVLVGQVRTLLQTLPGEPTIGLEALRAEAATRPLFYALGDRDEMVPLEEVLTIRRERPDSEVLVLPHAGHLFREYNPVVFSAAYTDFLRRKKIEEYEG